MRAKATLLFATSGHSGVDTIVKNLLPQFEHSSFHFDLVKIRGHGPYPDTIPANVSIHRLPAGSKNTLLPWLMWYLLRHKPEALLSANHKLNRTALLARKLTNTPSHVAIRMGMSITAKAEYMKPHERRSFFASMRRWYPLADAVIAPSHGVGEDLVNVARISRSRLHTIPNPVLSERFHSLAAETTKHPWLSDPELPVILSVGSLEPRKDYSTLLKAFAQVRAQRNCRLVILGNGRDRPHLLKLADTLGIKDDIDLPGFQQNPYSFMNAADVFVLSSLREGSSAVIVEALACGTPVVSTDCPSGPSEILQNGRFGRLVPLGDAQAMAEGIQATLDNPPSPFFLKEAVSEHRATLGAERYLQAMFPI